MEYCGDLSSLENSHEKKVKNISGFSYISHLLLNFKMHFNLEVIKGIRLNLRILKRIIFKNTKTHRYSYLEK